MHGSVMHYLNRASNVGQGRCIVAVVNDIVGQVPKVAGEELSRRCGSDVPFA